MQSNESGDRLTTSGAPFDPVTVARSLQQIIRAHADETGSEIQSRE